MKDLPSGWGRTKVRGRTILTPPSGKAEESENKKEWEMEARQRAVLEEFDRSFEENSEELERKVIGKNIESDEEAEERRRAFAEALNRQR